ncbi:hypothetical protein [Laspinema palackyanum]|uniref:hypothetical protein n=1 Tax=Laspinema palackyanum TaxID=3231601 RepID=UPI00345D9D74|nr:hypothetical protein [Laspinema sp. D2c]
MYPKGRPVFHFRGDWGDRHRELGDGGDGEELGNGEMFVVTTLVVSGFWVDSAFDKETTEAPK